MGHNTLRGMPGSAQACLRLATLTLAVLLTALGQAQVLYETGFEPDEGYDMQFTLAGQGGWLAEGTGGSGLVKETFTDMGNQAYVGFFPPEKDDESYLNLWRPITVPKTGAKRLKFSVAMMIADTEKEQRDEFRWSIYNSETKRLASIDFDNHNQEINFELDDGEGFKETEFSFERNAIYDLSIVMNFEKNHWSAFIGGETIVDKQLLTTTGAKLDLGDVSAVWVIREVGKPGDNYMVFDDYKIEQLEADKITPWLGENLAITMKNGVPVITLGPGKCALETSSDLKNWKVLTTSLENKTFTDADFNKKKSQWFYRLRLID